MTMLLPVSPRVRMSVQGKTKGTNGPLERCPCLRAGIFRKLNPSGDASQLRLRVGLHGICLLEDMSGDALAGAAPSSRKRAA